MLRINRRVLTLGAGVIVSGDAFLLTALDRHQRIPRIVRESKAGIGKGPARRIWHDTPGLHSPASAAISLWIALIRPTSGGAI